MSFPAQRFWSQVVVSDPHDCWLWTGPISLGYGRFYYDGEMYRVHRIVYELFWGPIPEGLEIDHVRSRGCHHKNCVNPFHLEAVTHAENMDRSPIGGWRHQRAKTHCPYGHPYDDDNTRTDQRGWRICLICRRAKDIVYHRERTARRRQAS